jgi:hypothetical protein
LAIRSGFKIVNIDDKSLGFPYGSLPFLCKDKIFFYPFAFTGHISFNFAEKQRNVSLKY